jgi:hypothetical protein
MLKGHLDAIVLAALVLAAGIVRLVTMWRRNRRRAALV